MGFCNAAIAGMEALLQNRIRSGLSILGIFIGIASVLCMVAIGDGAKQIIVDDIEKLGGPNQVHFETRLAIWRKDRIVRWTTERYTLEDAKAIEAECPDVLYALPRTSHLRPLVTNRNGNQALAILIGVIPEYSLAMRWEVQTGRFISENDVENANQVCILGANTATELFGEVSPIGQEVKLRYYNKHPPVRLRVVGVMKTKGSSFSTWYSLDDMICVPLTTHQQRCSGIGYVQNLDVFFQKDAVFDRLIENITDVLRKRHRGRDDFIEYWRTTYYVPELERIQKVIKIALGGIAGFSLFVSGIGIMNICLVSVGEKTREIGLRKSIGAKRIDMF